MEELTVGRVAELAAVTVRALHHWDEIGLLRPTGRSPAGYRLYAPADLDRLRALLTYRELGFPLDEIATLLDDAHADVAGHLRRQHALLTGRIARLQRVVRAVETEMEARSMGIELTPQERLEVFGTTEDHTAEAEQRWGDTEAYQESQRRARAYRKEDWVRFRTESDDLEQRLASALEAGTDPLSTTAMDLAEEHRQQVCTWFYDCPPAVHRSLGEMYVEDERFTAHYEQLGTGLARWVRDAWGANAVRQEGIASR